jgi:hypothetical protein
MAAGAIGSGRIGSSFLSTPRGFISAERADRFARIGHGVVLDGPRVERLRAMAEALGRVSGEIVLRLDPVDDHLFDIAAQQAGVSVKRGLAAPDGLGTLAYVTPQGRSLA